ncbi:MAG: YeeE/YedE family protein [Nannocystaceae bacterium]
MIAALLGGVLIGCSANIVEWAFGKPAGISGITASVISRDQTRWYSFFLLGLMVTGTVVALWTPELLVPTRDRSLLAMGIAGLLVGVGVRMGNGCTSGHGVCGVSRRRPRSILATTVFIAVGIGTVAALRVLMPGGV